MNEIKEPEAYMKRKVDKKPLHYPITLSNLNISFSYPYYYISVKNFTCPKCNKMFDYSVAECNTECIKQGVFYEHYWCYCSVKFYYSPLIILVIWLKIIAATIKKPSIERIKALFMTKNMKKQAYNKLYLERLQVIAGVGIAKKLDAGRSIINATPLYDKEVIKKSRLKPKDSRDIKTLLKEYLKAEKEDKKFVLEEEKEDE